MNNAVIFDLDGTIYCGEHLIDYAKESITQLQEAGYEIIYFTNNSSKTRKTICNKLINFGLNVDISRVYTASYATAKYLNQNNINDVFLIGTDGFKKELEMLDIMTTTYDKCNAVVIGLDISFNYDTISKALHAVSNGAKIIASNVDANFPVEGDILKPGSNAIVASIVGCSGKKVDYIVGKPNTYLLESIVKDFDLNKDKIWVVGDNMDSDIAMADNYGCKSILVGKNKTTLKDVVNIIRKRDS